MRNIISYGLLSALTLLLGAAPAAAASDRLYADGVNIEPGETRTITFNLDNSQEFFGFQADIAFPAGLEIAELNGKPDCSLSHRANSSYAMVSNRLSSGAIRVGAFSTDHTAISGDSGALLYVKVTAAADFAGGSLTVSDILFTDVTDNDVALPDCVVELGNEHQDRLYIPDFTITVGDETEVSIMLDNETQFSAFQSDIYLPEGLSVVPESAAMTSRGSGHALSIRDYGNGRVRLACLSLSGDVFTGDSGALVTLRVTATTQVSETSVIELRDNIFSTAGAREYVLPPSTTDVTIDNPVIPVSSLTMSETSAKASVGGTLQLYATITPADATDKTLIWESSDDNVATVTETGFVTFLDKGNVTITARAADGFGASATCDIEVDSLSGISRISVADDTIVRVYTLHGVPVYEGRLADTRLAPGTYVTVTPGHSAKLTVR
ncbi:MAG: Ig-like domain-containing protein [Pseudoflavonifractor sp.]|nr:Ig-like domain-containing protein [Pseudoflavonifractor sp.]